MRTPKFRAWDKEQGRFIYVTLNPMQIGWASPLYTAQHLQTDKNNNNAEGVLFEKIDDWQEHTGLKDKNGKEIYEGDIIVYPARSKDKKHVVIFENGAFTVGDTFPLGCVDEFIEEDMELEILDTEKFIEVISNIYKNKELLK